MEANEENFLDKINDTCKGSMTKAMTRIGERVALPTVVRCPECRKDVTVLVRSEPGKSNTLAATVKCKCGGVLPADSKLSDYE